MLRVRATTRERVARLAWRDDVSMAQVLDDAVLQYGRLQPRRMLMQQKLIYFVMYLDDKAQYVVAAKNKSEAESGFRQSMLGVLTFKTVRAVEATEAPIDDFMRVGLLAILTQIAGLNAGLAQAQAAARGPGLSVVGSREH